MSFWDRVHSRVNRQLEKDFAAPGALPTEVRRLVVAARRAFDLGYSDEEFSELDKALEPFASRVPYDPE